MSANQSFCRQGILYSVFLLCLVTLPSSWAAADGGFVPIFHPTLEIFRAAGPIAIDGDLSDDGWLGAAKAGNFAEHNPGDQTRPEVDTEVLITYDDDNLYVAWLCYDDPGEVRASFCERDNIFQDDYVILLLDPFGDATLAYEISANPYGIPGDLLFSSANGEDISYDMIYKSSGRITEFGWVVEMEIPFSSMRFPNKDEQVWKVDFWRNRPRESRYQYSWAAYNRDEDCWPCQWGSVTGVAGVKPGAGLELLPALIGSQSGSIRSNGSFSDEFKNEDFKGDVALGIAYDISSELTSEATINPDFSQVESDVAQIDVNTTFALFYPERRPFFQEGSDLFNTYFNAVYTRSINDPIAAGKMTWRKGSNSVAFLSARDDHSVITLPFEENSQFVLNGTSYSNILRAKHDLGEQSHLGLIATDRRFESGGSGSLVGIDGRIRLSASNSFQFQYVASHTEEVDDPSLSNGFNDDTFDNGKYTAGLNGETFWGQAIYAALSRSTANYWFGTEYWDRSPTFRADNGFETSNSWRLGSAWMGGILRFDENKYIENINGSMNLARKYNYDDVLKDEWINLEHQIRFRSAQGSIHTRYMYSNELFRGIQFDNIWLVHNCFSLQPWGSLQFGGYYDYGHRIARGPRVMGKETVTGIWADIKPIDRLMISSSLNHIFSNDLDTDEELFSQTVLRSRWSLQITRELSARLVLQYNDRYWDYVNNRFYDGWDIDPLITYQINPFSIIYIGSTHDYRDLTQRWHGHDGWTHTDRQFFMKVQYLIQL
jgi:hypothetical protein